MNFVKKKTTVLEDEINRVRFRMLEVGLDSSEYQDLLAVFERLIQLQNESKSNRVSPDTMAIVLGNLAGIGIIIGYERAHVITTRAMGFLLRTKHQ